MLTNLVSSKTKNALLISLRYTDESGFWVTDRVKPGRGGSANTFAHHICENGVYVLMRYYTPGPFDALAFGADSKLAQPHAEYSVYCGVLDLDDEAYKDAKDCVARTLAVNPNASKSDMAKGTWSVWSPDGEGALYLDFADLDIEHALAFANSLTPRNDD